MCFRCRDSLARWSSREQTRRTRQWLGGRRGPHRRWIRQRPSVSDAGTRAVSSGRCPAICMRRTRTPSLAEADELVSPPKLRAALVCAGSEAAALRRACASVAGVCVATRRCTRGARDGRGRRRSCVCRLSADPAAANGAPTPCSPRCERGPGRSSRSFRLV